MYTFEKPTFEFKFRRRVLIMGVPTMKSARKKLATITILVQIKASLEIKAQLNAENVSLRLYVSLAFIGVAIH